MPTDLKQRKPSMALRQQLLDQLNAEISRRGWTPKECEGELGMRQARVSELLNGKVEAFSADKLADIAYVLGFAVTTTFTKIGI